MQLAEFEKYATAYIDAMSELRDFVEQARNSKQPTRFRQRITKSQELASASLGKISHLISLFTDRKLDLGDGDSVDIFLYPLTISGTGGGKGAPRFGAMAMHGLLDHIRGLAKGNIDTVIDNLPQEKYNLPIEFGNSLQSAQEPKTSKDSKVFLVHGHSEEAVQETARFIEKLGLDLIILREQPSSGRTIIEKFIDFSDVGFAVVLLTGDDRGGTKATRFEEQQLRARQNVVLELGFFIGKLGRHRVCAICERNVEVPSDYSGVVFVARDPLGGWRLELAKEMKAAGLPIDMNRAV